MDLPGNMNMQELMKQAQQMQERMQDAQKQLADVEVVGEAGAGMVKVKMNGRHDVLSVKINESLMDEEVEMIEDLVAAACNDAAQKVEKASRDKIKELTKGMNLPPEMMGGGSDTEGGNQ